MELSEVKGLSADAEIKLVEDPYTEREARNHVVRIRDLIGAAGDRAHSLHGISAGLTLHDQVSASADDFAPHQNGADEPASPSSEAHSDAEYDFDAPPSMHIISQPRTDPAPKTVKSLSISAWNPPPHHLRLKGHLLYLQVTTSEGEQFQISSHVSGFFVNKSSNTKFDPFPRPAPKDAFAHSLLTLISKLSPSFSSSFRSLQEFNSSRDILSNLQITNALPACPWLVKPADTATSSHTPDVARTQETYLLGGIDLAETLRDWNEEFQSTRELPRATVQDRLFRERLTSKLFADFHESAARGAALVARGELGALNPTEAPDAQIFVHNNVFLSFGADGVGIFGADGGDEAARVAVGRDASGVRLVNQLDLDGLFTPGTAIVDYLGKRVVCQSIVPGIFKQRDAGDNQVEYGGVEGKDVIATNEAFVPAFRKLSEAFKIKRHDVWDKEGTKHTLEASVETKGLMGTDGRKYVLDLYRLTPPDVLWLEECWVDNPEAGEKPASKDYLHRLTVLRPELIDAYWRSKVAEYVIEKRKAQVDGVEDGKTSAEHTVNGEMTKAEGDAKPETTAKSEDDAVAHDAVKTHGDSNETLPDAPKPPEIDLSDFSFALNPDVFCGQTPQTDQEKAEWERDEREVRDVCEYLRSTAIPEMVYLCIACAGINADSD